MALFNAADTMVKVGQQRHQSGQVCDVFRGGDKVSDGVVTRLSDYSQL